MFYVQNIKYRQYDILSFTFLRLQFFGIQRKFHFTFLSSLKPTTHRVVPGRYLHPVVNNSKVIYVPGSEQTIRGRLPWRRQDGRRRCGFQFASSSKLFREYFRAYVRT